MQALGGSSLASESADEKPSQVCSLAPDTGEEKFHSRLVTPCFSNLLRPDDTDARPARSPTEFEASIDFRIGWRFWHWGAVTQTHEFFICGSFTVANRFPRVLRRSSI